MKRQLKAIYDNLVNSISTFIDTIEEEIFLSKDKWVQCHNEYKYNHSGYKNNRQKGYDKKENFDKWQRKTPAKDSFGDTLHHSTGQSIHHWEKKFPDKSVDNDVNY